MQQVSRTGKRSPCRAAKGKKNPVFFQTRLCPSSFDFSLFFPFCLFLSFLSVSFSLFLRPRPPSMNERHLCLSRSFACCFSPHENEKWEWIMNKDLQAMNDPLLS